MSLSHLPTASLAGALVCFISGAEASPRLQAPLVSPLPVQAGFKCGLENGRLVCGNRMAAVNTTTMTTTNKEATTTTTRSRKTPMMIPGCRNAPFKGQILVAAAKADLSMSAKN